jgi:uroporphyrinogen-III synthase
MASKIKKILVSQPQPGPIKSPYQGIAQKYGVEIVFRPFIRVERLTEKEFRNQKIYIQDYSGVVLTSRTAVDCFFQFCEKLSVEISPTMIYICVSEVVAFYLQKYVVFRRRRMVYPKTARLEDLVPFINRFSDKKYLVPVSDIHKKDLFLILDEQQVDYTKAVMFRTVSNDFPPDEPFDYDVLLFFSPAGIASLKRNFPNFAQNETVIGTFGPATAQAATDAGFRIDIEAPNSQAPSMSDALDIFLKTADTPLKP